jgi:phytanoyl-CoA hydroxylase
VSLPQETCSHSGHNNTEIPINTPSLSYFTHMRSTGIIAPESDPRDGIFDTSSSPTEFNSIGSPSYPDAAKLQAIAAAHCTPQYLAFLQNPELHEFVRSFMRWTSEVLLPRTLLRHSVPYGISSAIHYDKIFLRGGDPASEFLTAWVPIGDTAHDGGGLIYLKNSTEIGRRIEANFTKRAQTLSAEDRIRAYNQNMAANGSLGTDAEEFYQGEGRDFKRSTEWLTTDYEAGDCIFHNPYIVHGTTLNEDKLNRIRLSTDLRFYQEGSSLDERWLKLWAPTDGL